KGTAILDKAAARVRIGNIAHLLIGNIQQLCQLRTVRRGLIEHDHKFRDGKHSSGLYRIQKILDILRDCGWICSALSKLPPCGIEENAALLIFKNDVKFVNENVGTLALFPVESDTVENRIGDNQKAGGS